MHIQRVNIIKFFVDKQFKIKYCLYKIEKVLH